MFFLSVYQIVVEEERPRRTKKATEILKCYPVPIHFQNASLLNSHYYFAAEIPANGLLAAQPFTIGDNKTYSGFWNTPLLPHKSYSIYFQAASRANGVGLATRHDFILCLCVNKWLASTSRMPNLVANEKMKLPWNLTHWI